MPQEPTHRSSRRAEGQFVPLRRSLSTRSITLLIDYRGTRVIRYDVLNDSPEQAIRLSPGDPDILIWCQRIGEAYLVKSRLDEAIFWLERGATPIRHSRPIMPGSPPLMLSGEIPNGLSFELTEARRLSGDDPIRALPACRPPNILRCRPSVCFSRLLFHRAAQGRVAGRMTAGASLPYGTRGRPALGYPGSSNGRASQRQAPNCWTGLVAVM